jgi:pimeloyl-CoA synthetase
VTLQLNFKSVLKKTFFKLISLFPQIADHIEEISEIITNLLTSLGVAPEPVQEVLLYIKNITRAVAAVILNILQESYTEPTTGIEGI